MKVLSRDVSGTSAIEFALIAPVFLLMLLGMVAYGIYFGASNSIQQLAADAARTAIAGLDTAERQALVNTYLDRNAEEYPFVNRGKLTVNIAEDSSNAGQFVVSLSYDAADLPIWNLFKDLPMPGKTIARTSTIRVGGA